MKTSSLGLALLLAALLSAGKAAHAQSINPNIHDFGAVTLGNASAVQVFSFDNTSPDPATLAAVSLGGAAGAQYQILAGSCVVGLVVPPAGSCTVSVRFQPNAAGNQVALLRILFNQPPPNPPGGIENTATLIGQGVPPSPPVAVPGPGPLAALLAALALVAGGLVALRRRQRQPVRAR